MLVEEINQRYIRDRCDNFIKGKDGSPLEGDVKIMKNELYL